MASIFTETDQEEAWGAVRWPIRLETPPQVVAVGRGLHGLRGPEQYRLPDLWSLHLYSYSATLRLAGHVLPIRPGHIGLTPPGTLARYEFQGPSPHLYAHFCCVNSFNPDETDGVTIPAMLDAGIEHERFSRQIEGVVRGGGNMPARTQASVWALLCELADLSPASGEAALHPAVRLAVSEIEMRLGEPLSASGLAESADVSYSHLARLFQEAFGTSIVAYLRARRVQQAEHLLRHSTLPIKTIAAQVGLADLHFFNKTIRRHLGLSPRQIRKG